MKFLSEEAFLEIVRAKGITISADYPDCAFLDYGSATEGRYWVVPPEPERRPRFILALLNLMGDWDNCFAWRHDGSWPDVSNPETREWCNPVDLCILTNLGMPMGTADVVEFERAELDLLATLIFTSTVFGWSRNSDLIIVPEHGRQVLGVDHHNVIHAFCSNAQEMERWIKEMAKQGFPLPTKPPDGTFYRAPWMPPE